jgi:hypothetical protein
MFPAITSRSFLAAACLIFAAAFAPPVVAETPAQQPPKGLRVATAGHSFHVWMPAMLAEMAGKDGITGHEKVALSSIGGSQVIQHWNKPDDKNEIKPVLIASKADVLTLSPIYLPDEGIENFAKLGLEHNPALRITVQEFWLPFDDQALWASRAKGEKPVVDRDAKTIAQLREAHAPYLQAMDEHVRALNAKFGKSAIFVVPAGQAVLALREKVIKGEAPGIAKQTDLFTDPIGHPREHIKVLATYCHFAVIYGRSPVGQPMPASIAKLPEAEKLNRLLQELAWDAVTQHPLSGIKATAAR